MSGAPVEHGRGRSRRVLLLVAVAGILLSAFFAGLGVWQVERRAWKLDLIDRVEARVAAEPVVAPGRADWAAISASSDEYRRVSLQGAFRNDEETLVQAVTEAGPGFWVMTPFVRSNGETVLVNRGFVPPDRRDPATRSDGQVTGETSLVGLLRVSEPGGGFLRANDPAAGRWFSRDVAAIGEANALSNLAPFFVDAEAGSAATGGPLGGLTVIAFRNHHLVYAITWFALSLMVAGATAFVFVDDRRRRNGGRALAAERAG